MQAEIAFRFRRAVTAHAPREQDRRDIPHKADLRRGRFNADDEQQERSKNHREES
jgi:hypothetical protein